MSLAEEKFAKLNIRATLGFVSPGTTYNIIYNVRMPRLLELGAVLQHGSQSDWEGNVTYDTYPSCIIKEKKWLPVVFKGIFRSPGIFLKDVHDA